MNNFCNACSSIFVYLLTVFSLFPRDMLSSLAETAFSFFLLRGERVESMVTFKKNKINYKAALNIKHKDVRKLKQKKDAKPVQQREKDGLNLF